MDNPEFEKHIPDLYPSEIKLNQANTWDKESYFLESNIKVIRDCFFYLITFIPAFTTNAMDIPIINFPWLSGDVPRLPSSDSDIWQLVRFAMCCNSIFDFRSKYLQITSKLLAQSYIYHKLRKMFGNLSKFGEISFQKYVSKGISHPVTYGDVVYELKRVKGVVCYISSGWKIVKTPQRRHLDPLIIVILYSN